MTLLICWANSLVGARMTAWHWGDLGSISCKTPIENVAVLPVPDWAWAIVSFLLITGRIPRCWMIDGFSKPKAKLEIRYHKLLWVGLGWGWAIKSFQPTSTLKFS
jgi:hypothetical protein